MKELTGAGDIDKCLAASADQPVLIFKHSTACPISARAHHELTDFLEAAGPNSPETYMVKVIEQRATSTDVASRLDVQHQSPQLILVRRSRAVWSASHLGIEAEAIEEALKQHGDPSG